MKPDSTNEIINLWLSFSFFAEILIILAIFRIVIVALLNKNLWGKEVLNGELFYFLLWWLPVIFLSILWTEFQYHYMGWKFQNVVYYAADNLFITTPLLVFAKMLLLIFTFFCVYIHKPYFVKEGENWEYSIIILILLLSMLLLISCNNLFLAFLAMELQTLSLYIFISLKHYSNLAMEIAVKYFVYSGFSSACLIFGISTLYAIYGTVSFIELSVLLDVNTFNLHLVSKYITGLAFILILIGFLFKLAQAPFYFWIGDVFQGSYYYVGSYLSIVAKLPIWILFIKILHFILLPSIYTTLILILKIVAIASIAVSSFYALSELNFKRFWALSSVGHMGYILLALTLEGYLGITIALFYLIIYIVCNIFLWTLLINTFKVTDIELPFKEFVIKLSRMLSFRNTKIIFSFAAALVLFSLAGIPPGFGFLPKIFLFFYLYKKNNLFILAFVFFLNLVSLAYYLRIVRFLLFDSYVKENIETFEILPRKVLYILVLCFMLNLFFCYFFVDIIVYIPLSIADLII